MLKIYPKLSSGKMDVTLDTKYKVHWAQIPGDFNNSLEPRLGEQSHATSNS